MTTLTATSAADELLADVRQLLARHSGAGNLDELLELADDLTTALKRARGRISRLRKREQPAETPAPKPEAQPEREASAVTEQSQPVTPPRQTPMNGPQTHERDAVTQPQPYPPQSAPQVTPMREPSNGFGITALVLAIIGLVFGLIPITGFIALILGALALLFAFLGWGRVKRRTATNRKMTIIGGLLGAGAIALGIWGMTIVFSAVEEFDKEFGKLDAYTKCVNAIDIEDPAYDAKMKACEK